MYTVQVRFIAVNEESSCTRSCTKGKKTPNNWRSTNLIIANSTFPYLMHDNFLGGRCHKLLKIKLLLDRRPVVFKEVLSFNLVVLQKKCFHLTCWTYIHIQSDVPSFFLPFLLFFF